MTELCRWSEHFILVRGHNLFQLAFVSISDPDVLGQTFVWDNEVHKDIQRKNKNEATRYQNTMIIIHSQ